MVIPEYIDLKYWAAQLIVDYPNENLPILDDEKKWPEWGAAVVGSGIFARNNAPSPFTISEGRKKSNFEDWHTWARALYIAMLDTENTNQFIG
jgi:hypothetical protein